MKPHYRYDYRRDVWIRAFLPFEWFALGYRFPLLIRPQNAEAV